MLAWFGSLINGPISDNLGRKGSMLMAVVVFVLGSCLQAGGSNIETIFAGRAVAGLAVGMLTMVVPQYLCKSLLSGCHANGEREMGEGRTGGVI